LVAASFAWCGDPNMSSNFALFRVLLFFAGSLSVGSLLLYFFGVATFSLLCLSLSAVEIGILAFLTWWAWSQNWLRARRLLISGLWAGLLATLAYDLVRVPIVHGGVPVFKAISYFGTALLGKDRPTVASEFLGWSYHLSNSVSFALMYAAIMLRPGVVTAVLWGLVLEGVMLITPYAEVFGYQRDAKFMAITIGSHVVFGLVLWLGLRYCDRVSMKPAWMGAAAVLVPVCLTLIAADFHSLYARKIPPSPPGYMGPHLYTVWSVPEPDRVAVIWLTKRYVDRDAVFHFIEPFEKVKYGKPFDMPEAQVRRSGTQSATEVVRTAIGGKDKKLDALAHMTGLTEISPWMLATDEEAGHLAERMRKVADTACGRSMTITCLPVLLQDLDGWYKSPIQ
jgi:hypothetical protein